MPAAAGATPLVVVLVVRIGGDLNGIELTRRLLDLGLTIRVVVWTLLYGPVIAANAMEAGADAVLDKAGSPRGLVAAIQSAWADMVSDTAQASG